MTRGRKGLAGTGRRSIGKRDSVLRVAAPGGACHLSTIGVVYYFLQNGGENAKIEKAAKKMRLLKITLDLKGENSILI
jgi:hypothetical protein